MTTSYSPTSHNPVNLDSVRQLLESRMSKLKCESLGRSDFFNGWGDPPEIRETFEKGLDFKRQGELEKSNYYFCESFRREEKFHSPFVWSWCKIMILAKNWECLRDLLEYHFDMMVVWNRLMREKGNQDYFDNYVRWYMVPHFEFEEFHAGEHLRDQVHSPLIEKEEAISRLSEFGGSPYWTINYSMTDSEWREFQHLFPIPTL